jgi:hypothetical protein
MNYDLTKSGLEELRSELRLTNNELKESKSELGVNYKVYRNEL